MSGSSGTIVIFGCGGHGRSVADVLLATSPGAKVVFVDANARPGETILGFDVLKDYPLGGEEVFLAAGDNAARQRSYEQLGGASLKLRSIVAATAHRGRASSIARGCFVGNFCHIGPEAILGTGTIVNNGAIIEHEVKVGAFCHIGPNATISGRCTLGDLVFVGVGATVKDSVSICANVVIGAGATVVADITEPGTYVGTPARRIR